jgi:hypothetical protein
MIVARWPRADAFAAARYIADCQSLELAQWQQRPFRSRLADHLARLFSPLL